MSHDDDDLPPFNFGDDDHEDDDFEFESEFELSSILEEAERQIRIQKMREELEKRGGTLNQDIGAAELSPEAEEAMLERVLFFESAPRTTHAKMLIADGIELPTPEALEAAELLHAKLWEVIHGLAQRRVFLHCTDHLSDRALYCQLWYHHLNDETIDISGDQDAACHLDLLGGGSEEETLQWLKYYADEEEREWWRDSLEDEGHIIPDRENPPYNRDALLPKREH